MKIRYQLQLALIILIFSGRVSAQDILTKIMSAPDTVNFNSSHNVKLYVKNLNSTGPYSNGIYLYYKTSLWPNGEYFGSVFESIGAQSFITYSAPIEFNSKLFKTGNNIIVIWPTYSGGKIGKADSVIVYVREEGRGEGINDENSLASYFSLYPNPFTNKLSLQINELKIHVERVRILDVTGREILSVKNNIDTLDLSALFPGIYFVEIETTQGNKVTKKVLKQE